MNKMYGIIKLDNDGYIRAITDMFNDMITFETLKEADKYANELEEIERIKDLRVISLECVEE